MSRQKKDYIFSQRLSKAMIEKNIAPAQLSKITGIKRELIYEYLNGNSQPNAFNIARIAKGLHISSDWLLGLIN